MKNKVLSIVAAFGLSLCLLILTLTAVHVPDLQASIVEPSPPIVVNQQPPANSYTWPMTTAVSLTYDQAISPSTVNTHTFVVHAMQTGILTEVHGIKGGTIFLTPSLPFKPGELVQVSATTGTVSLSGERPLTPTVWQFSTAPTAGSGIFASEYYTMPNSQWIGVNVVPGDFNKDGYLDVFAVTVGPNTVWFNDGNGRLVNSGQELASSGGAFVVTGDIDNDSDLDVIATGGNARIWLNDGNGYFSGNVFSLYLQRISHLNDLNGDGYLDFIAYRYDIGTRVWLNNGQGHFTYTQQTINDDALSLGDLDQDSDLDLVARSSITRTSIWLNNGQGFFAHTGQYMNTDWVWAAALGDLNQNGYLDIFFARHDGAYGDANEVWFNDGDAFFTNSQQQLGGGASRSVVLADFDNDDDLDAYVANKCCSGNSIDEIWLNDGTGMFTEGQHFVNSSTFASGVGDIDNDGDIDIFVGAEYYSQYADFMIHINKGAPIDGLQAMNSSPTAIGEATVLTATVAAGSVASYNWDLGDGQGGNGAVISHIYPAVGVYTAVVTATNSASSMTVSTTVVITTTPPILPGYMLYLPFIAQPAMAVSQTSAYLHTPPGRAIMPLSWAISSAGRAVDF